MSKTKQRKKCIQEIDGEYSLPETMTRQAIIELALTLQFKDLKSRQLMTSPVEVKRYFRLRLSDYSKEVFSVMFLSTKHQVIECKDMFIGTIDSASVYIRDILIEVLRLNASAVIVAHNHPSGMSEPSRADEHLTKSIAVALSYISVNLLDHIVVGDGETVSLAERGLIHD